MMLHVGNVLWTIDCAKQCKNIAEHFRFTHRLYKGGNLGLTSSASADVGIISFLWGTGTRREQHMLLQKWWTAFLLLAQIPQGREHWLEGHSQGIQTLGLMQYSWKCSRPTGLCIQNIFQCVSVRWNYRTRLKNSQKINEWSTCLHHPWECMPRLQVLQHTNHTASLSELRIGQQRAQRINSRTLLGQCLTWGPWQQTWWCRWRMQLPSN